MKIKVFNVTYSSYTASDNFLLDGTDAITTNAEEALAVYNQVKKDAYDIAHTPDEDNEERKEAGTCRVFDVREDERMLGTIARGYIVTRAKNTADEFQARVFLTEREIDLPDNIVVPTKQIGDKMTWRIDGDEHKHISKVEAIYTKVEDNGDGTPLTNVKYLTTYREQGKRKETCVYESEIIR